MKFKNCLKVMVVLLLLASMLFGCEIVPNDDPGTSEEQTTPDEQSAQGSSTLKINGVAVNAYTLVYSKKAADFGTEAVAYFNKKIERFGEAPESSTETADRYEILIGQDGGDAAIAAAFQSSPEGFIGVSGKKIFLLGANYGALCQVIDAFFAKAQGDIKNMEITVAANEAVNVKKDSVKVMSYNILQDWNKEGRPDDFLTKMADTIRQQDPDVFGTQESTTSLYENSIGTVEGYDYFKGMAHRDSIYLGNYVYWKSAKFTAVEKGHQFMSDTPNTKSKYEESNAYRGFTYVFLESKETGNRFLFICVHTDYRGPVDSNGNSDPTGDVATALRAKQLRVLTAFLKKAKWADVPAIIVGDFNDTPTKVSITSFQNDNYPRIAMTSKVAETKGDTGGTLATNGFIKRESYIFDYIFVTKDQINTKYYTVVNNINPANGKYPSDHLPVFAEIEVY